MSSIAVFLVLGGGAYAATQGIPGSDGVIHGCYQKSKGTLRVVATGKKCQKKSELAIFWSQKGQPGAPGQTGVAGQPGATGAAGAAGAAGTARAYAIISPNGTGGPTKEPGAKNVTAVTRGAAGQYCVTIDATLGIDTAYTPAILSPNWQYSLSNDHGLFAYVASSGSCDADPGSNHY